MRLTSLRDQILPREAAAVLLGALFALGGMPGSATRASAPTRLRAVGRLRVVVRLVVRGIRPADGELTGLSSERLCPGSRCRPPGPASSELLDGRVPDAIGDGHHRVRDP